MEIKRIISGKPGKLPLPINYKELQEIYERAKPVISKHIEPPVVSKLAMSKIKQPPPNDMFNAFATTHTIKLNEFN